MKTKSTTPKVSLGEKLYNAMVNQRPVSVSVSAIPGKAAKAEATQAAKTYGVTASKFQFGKDTFYAVTETADDAYEIDNFYSKNGKFAGTYEADF